MKNSETGIYNLSLEWEKKNQKQKKKFKKIIPFDQNRRSLKQLIRHGIPDKYRSEIWFLSSGGMELLQSSGNIWQDILATKLEPFQQNIISTFGFPNYDLFYDDPQLISLLNIIKNQNNNVLFSPIIPSTASMLLLYLDQEKAYFALQAMINTGDRYFTLSKEKFVASMHSFENILSYYSHRLAEHTKSLNILIGEIAFFVIPLFFTTKMLKEVALVICDSFVSEGRKVMVRYFIGILLRIQNQLLETNTADEFMNAIVNYLTLLQSPEEMHDLTDLSFSIRLSQERNIAPAEQKALRRKNTVFNVNVLPMIEDFSTSHFYSPLFESMKDSNFTFSGCHRWNISLSKSTGINMNNGKLITKFTFAQIQSRFPQVFRRYEPKYIYLLSVDGTSFYSFIKNVTTLCPYMLVIKTPTKLFGAVFSDPPCPQNNGQYFGNPTTTVFDITENKVYRSTGKNTQFISVSSEAIIVGAHNIAIFIPNGFKRVSSDFCQTFDSPRFTSSEAGDSILDMELYKLLLPAKTRT